MHDPEEVAVEGLDAQTSSYHAIGFDHRTGFGRRPALLVIDMCQAITEDATSPLYIDMTEAISYINDLAGLMRDRSLPVVHTTVAYTPPDFADGGRFIDKIPSLRVLEQGSSGSKLDSRLSVEVGDYVIEKKFASGFYGTHLQSLLTGLHVDTTIVCGNSTSGCVRATVVDAVSGGFRVVVPEEGVADRADLSHRVNLFDMNAKYADVVPISNVIGYVKELAGDGYEIADGRRIRASRP